MYQIVILNITYPEESGMSVTNVQFTVAAHIMAALGFNRGQDLTSATLAKSINADASFVRKSLSKLAKAGLVRTKRGKNGASALTRSPGRITLLDVYRASEAPQAFAIHAYPVQEDCLISCNIKRSLSTILKRGQASFETTLAGITLADLVSEIRKKGS
jgi:Rrf2 family protein